MLANQTICSRFFVVCPLEATRQFELAALAGLMQIVDVFQLFYLTTTSCLRTLLELSFTCATFRLISKTLSWWIVSHVQFDLVDRS